MQPGAVFCCRNSLDSLRPYVAFGEEYARGGKGKQPRRPVRLLYRNGESGSQSRAWPQQLVQLLIAAIYLVFQASWFRVFPYCESCNHL